MKIILYFPGMQPKDLDTHSSDTQYLKDISQQAVYLPATDPEANEDTEPRSYPERLRLLDTEEIQTVFTVADGELIKTLCSEQISFILVLPKLDSSKDRQAYYNASKGRSTDDVTLEWISLEGQVTTQTLRQYVQSSTNATIITLEPHVDIEYIFREVSLKGSPVTSVIARLGVAVNYFANKLTS